MPFNTSDYVAHRLLFNRHIETIYPALFRSIEVHESTSMEIETPDGDFLQFDWYRRNRKKVVIISHGLEGDSSRPYIKGMVNAFVNENWDAIAWNYRGCGSKMNRKEILYHSGASYDLETVVHFAQDYYQQIFLVGFSLGGNITLKFLGEKKREDIAGACVFSVPIDLLSCSLELEKPHNWIYSKRFLRNLKYKVKQKIHLLNGKYPFKRLNKINTIYKFDDCFTAPLHGFKNARDYYEKSSSKKFLQHIEIPTLLVNALNDPFLSKECYPIDLAKNHKFLYFESPNTGGHVGFSSFNKNNLYWSEKRALEFANTLELR